MQARRSRHRALWRTGRTSGGDRACAGAHRGQTSKGAGRANRWRARRNRAKPDSSVNNLAWPRSPVGQRAAVYCPPMRAGLPAPQQPTAYFHRLVQPEAFANTRGDPGQMRPFPTRLACAGRCRPSQGRAGERRCVPGTHRPRAPKTARLIGGRPWTTADSLGQGTAGGHRNSAVIPAKESACGAVPLFAAPCRQAPRRARQQRPELVIDRQGAPLATSAQAGALPVSRGSLRRGPSHLFRILAVRPPDRAQALSGK
jgi:hypothetical protein